MKKCKGSAIKDIEKIGDVLKEIDVNWEVHLEAEINVNDMDIKVTFDKPADPK
jgi:hypothetical protein